MKPSISVLTIVKSREDALVNLLKGLELSSLIPDEVIIVHMNEPANDIVSKQFPVKSFEMQSDERLPLAAARNFAVEQSSSSHIIFLDVDCIPGPELVQDYVHAFQSSDKLWTGPVRYLRNGATNDPDFLQKLDTLSSPDPVRGALENLSYELFWSLNFGCGRAIFEEIGGFDTAFRGYGAEDTDFSFTARTKGVSIGATRALAYHQYHSSYDPPLNHLEDIVKNAQTFYEKWGIWPMRGWLTKFVAAGLIQWEEEGISILRLPEQDEIDAVIKP